MTIEVTAKKVEDAINQGLQQLGASLDEVNVEVVESGGLFRKAKVRLTLERDDVVSDNEEKPSAKAPTAEKPVAAKPAEKPRTQDEKTGEQKTKPVSKPKKSENRPEQKPAADVAPVAKADIGSVKPSKPTEATPRKKPEEDKAAEKRAAEFIKDIVGKMGFDAADVALDEEKELVEITAPSGDDSLLIGRHGETLSALSYIAETVARAEKCHINITVDCNGYRARRAASLTAMAKRRANECAAKHRKIKLEAMERIDRRTIHNALTDDDRVSTASEGKEPYRYVVILPKNKQ